MANLDISIVIFALFVVLMLDILSIGIKVKYFALFGMLFGIASIAYFVQNYTAVSIGTSFTIPFQLFIIAWVLLPICSSAIIVIKS